MSNLLSELRYAARVLGRSRGYTAFAVAMLAAGIGSVTAVVSVSRAVLGNPGGYRAPERIVEVENRTMDTQPQAPFPVKAADYLDFRARSRTLGEWALHRREGFNLTGDGNPERVTAVATTASVFALLGAAPALGRTLTAEDEQPGQHRVLVLAHGFWKRRFGGDPAAIGRRVEIEGAAYTVVGVMPENFEFPDSASEAWVPLVVPPKELQERFMHRHRAWARLGDGVSLAAADQELRSLAAQLREEHPRVNRNMDAAVVPWQQRTTGAVAPALRLLGAAVGLLLLLVSANIANLMIARLNARRREFEVRAALGGSLGQLLRQLFVENVLLAAAGGAAGLVLAQALLAGLTRIAPQGIAGLDKARLDAGTLGGTVAATALTAILFGLLPGWAALRGDAAAALRSRGEAGRAGAVRARQILAVAQFALAVMVLAASGLLLRSFAKVLDTPLGFEPRGVLTARVALPPAKYPDNPAIADFYARLVERVRALPGVEHAAMVGRLPLDGTGMTGPVLLRNVPDDRQNPAQVDHRAITPDYFRTAGIPLLAGREFTAADGADAPPVVIVDETVARTYFPGEDPLGKVIQPGSPQLALPWSTIVGVVGPIHNDGLEAATAGQVYAPLPQRPRPSNHTMGLVIKVARGKPEDLGPAVQAAVRELDPDQPVFAVTSMETLLARTLAPRRFALWLLGLFSLVCLVLSGIGLFAVVSYSVTQRVREIGVRMALGAEPGQIAGVFLRSGAVTWGCGVAAGLAGSAAISRLYASMLVGTPRFDPVTMSAVAFGLGLVALAASYLPARRAAALDPAAVLRAE